MVQPLLAEHRKEGGEEGSDEDGLDMKNYRGLTVGFPVIPCDRLGHGVDEMLPEFSEGRDSPLLEQRELWGISARGLGDTDEG